MRCAFMFPFSMSKREREKGPLCQACKVAEIGRKSVRRKREEEESRRASGRERKKGIKRMGEKNNVKENMERKREGERESEGEDR